MQLDALDTWVANGVVEHYKQYTALSCSGDDGGSESTAHATPGEEHPQRGGSTAAVCARTLSLHGWAEHLAPAAVARCGSLHLDLFGVMTPPKARCMPHFSRGSSSSAGGAIPSADDASLGGEGHLGQHPTLAWYANQVWDDGEWEGAAAEEAEADFEHYCPSPPWPINEEEGMDEGEAAAAAEEAAAKYMEGFRMAHLPQLPAQQLCAVMWLLADVQQALVSGDQYAACNMVAGGISGAWRAHALAEAREAPPPPPPPPQQQHGGGW